MNDQELSQAYPEIIFIYAPRTTRRSSGQLGSPASLYHCGYCGSPSVRHSAHLRLRGAKG